METTRPTRGSRGPSGRPMRCATSSGPPERAPERTTSRKSRGAVTRFWAASTAGGRLSLRRRGGCGPCGDARTGSTGRRACACAGGSRGSCDADGCSAGRCACSTCSLHSRIRALTVLGQSKPVSYGRQSPVGINWHRAPTIESRRTVMDMRHRSSGFDLATVRARVREGQFGARPAGGPGQRHIVPPVSARLWTTRRRVVETCGEPVDPHGSALLGSNLPPLPPRPRRAMPAPVRAARLDLGPRCVRRTSRTSHGTHRLEVGRTGHP